MNEMICHLSDQIRLALGLKSAEYSGNKFKEKFLIHLILWGIHVPKKDVETVIEMKQNICGTNLLNFTQMKIH